MVPISTKHVHAYRGCLCFPPNMYCSHMYGCHIYCSQHTHKRLLSICAWIPVFSLHHSGCSAAQKPFLDPWSLLPASRIWLHEDTVLEFRVCHLMRKMDFLTPQAPPCLIAQVTGNTGSRASSIHVSKAGNWGWWHTAALQCENWRRAVAQRCIKSHWVPGAWLLFCLGLEHEAWAVPPSGSSRESEWCTEACPQSILPTCRACFPAWKGRHHSERQLHSSMLAWGYLLHRVQDSAARVNSLPTNIFPLVLEKG